MMDFSTIVTIFGWWTLVGAFAIHAFPTPKTNRSRMFYVFAGGALVWLVAAFEWYGKKNGYPPGWWSHWDFDRSDTDKDIDRDTKKEVHQYPDGLMVTIERSRDKDNEIADRLVEWCVEHNAFNGESIMQMDGPQIDAAPFLSNLVDEVLQPDVKYEDEDE